MRPSRQTRHACGASRGASSGHRRSSRHGGHSSTPRTPPRRRVWRPGAADPARMAGRRSLPEVHVPCPPYAALGTSTRRARVPSAANDEDRRPFSTRAIPWRGSPASGPRHGIERAGLRTDTPVPGCGRSFQRRRPPDAPARQIPGARRSGSARSRRQTRQLGRFPAPDAPARRRVGRGGSGAMRRRRPGRRWARPSATEAPARSPPGPEGRAGSRRRSQPQAVVRAGR